MTITSRVPDKQSLIPCYLTRLVCIQSDPFRIHCSGFSPITVYCLSTPECRVDPIWGQGRAGVGLGGDGWEGFYFMSICGNPDKMADILSSSDANKHVIT